MKKEINILAVLLLINTFSYAQILTPALWHYQPSRQQVQVGDTVDLIFTVTLEDNWYIYSNDFDPDLGPMPTSFEFEQNGSYERIGKVEAIDPKRKYDPVWEGEISYLEGKAVFRQAIKVLTEELLVKGSYSYQVCSSVDGKCIPGTGDFHFDNIEITAVTIPKPERKERKEKSINKEDGKSTTSDTVNWKSGIKETPSVQEQAGQAFGIEGNPEGIGKATASINANRNLWQFALLAFLAGLAALLTPCVFPMIPMTVTFFTHQGEGQAFRKAMSYGFSIILIYTVAGTLVAWINGPAFANWLSTHWLPNLFFFAVFVTFALSFLGLFEITLPSGLVNMADRKADKKGLAGIFFMAFTLVLVSFSCTGPIVGALLVASAGGEVLMPVIGMASFALAMAVPFTLFAAFPQWLGKLPKSGGWLNSVKVVLGFLELALGLKFLSVADQVYHWGILDREVYLALWIVLFSMIGLYLLGKIKLPHDEIMVRERLGVPRLMLAIGSFAFVVYLVPGMFGAPLKALAGYLPPMTTQDYHLTGPAANNVQYVPNGQGGLCEEPLYADMLRFPHGIRGYFDLEQAIACAKEQQKPVFIDFTGHGCVNCREMEARVWDDPEVLQSLKQDFVMLALYVDEKTELPEPEWYRSTFDGKVKKTMGAQNADYQITRFQNNAQPFYVILDPYTQEVLVEPKAYDLKVANFLRFLKDGKEKFDVMNTNYEQ